MASLAIRRYHPVLMAGSQMRNVVGVGGIVAIVGAVSCLSGQGASAQPQVTPRLALVGGTLLQGPNGETVRDSVVLIDGDRIAQVGTVETLRVPPGYQRVSTEGMTVLPGLWDMHTHLQYSASADLNGWNARYLPQMERVIMPAIAEQLLLAGVTSARDMMAPIDAILNVRARIARNEIPGPTMYVAGALLEHAPPAGAESYRWPVSGVDDARAKVNRLADRKVDVIKLLCVPDMAQAEADAVVRQAHERGLMVAAHGRTDDEIRKCLAAGVDDLQHLSPQAELPDDIVAAIRARVRQGPPLYWTPTVGGPINNRYLRDDPEPLDDPSWQRGLPRQAVDDVRSSLRDFPRLLKERPAQVAQDEPLYRRKFSQLRGAGVELLVGTDSGNPGHFHPYATWLELDAWVNHFGIQPADAIRRATLLAARVMKVERDYGTVEAGKYADIIAVKGDPLRQIAVLRDVAYVFKHGRRYK